MIDPADFVTHPLPIAAPIVLYFQSLTRVYRAELDQDLLNDWIVMLSWSGKSNRRGGQQVKVVPNSEAGVRLLKEVIKTRERRGYKLLSPNAAFNVCG